MTFAIAGSPLSGEKIRLAPFSRQHLQDPAYIGWLRDAAVVRTLNLPSYLEKPVSFAEISAYCERVMSSATDQFYAIELHAPALFAGTLKVAGYNAYTATADIGIMIGRRDLWGQGLASDAVRTICRDLFGRQGLRRLTAGSMAINAGMIRVFEKLGFRREGCFRRHDRLGDEYIDHIHLGCFADEFVG